MNDDYVQRHEIEDLEWRLSQKIDEIEEVREQNSRLALDAAWGIVPNLNSLGIWGLAFGVVATNDWPWWGNLALLGAAGFASVSLRTKANDDRMKEVATLHRIKPWKTPKRRP